MNELNQTRNEIDQIDRQMADLFTRRMKASEKIAAYKAANGLSVKDLVRENEVIEQNRKMIADPEIASFYVELMKKIIQLSCCYQEKKMNGLKVSYCGAEGAFAHIAAEQMFPSASATACKDFAEAYSSVESGESDCAILPLENSYAGEVGAVMDLVFSGSLFINQVMNLSIVHNLIAKKGTKPEDIRTVVSHPQALLQCDDYIRSHGYETKSFSNTALAAKYVSESKDSSIAAIASSKTADLYGLNILQEKINASQNNTTRFASFSRVENKLSSTNQWKDEVFMLVFTVKNEPGALAKTLNIIGSHGFNMRNLRSRPMKGLLWSYYFYLEAEGNINTSNGSDMLQELSAVCAKLKLVGSYYADTQSMEWDGKEQ